MQRAVEIAGGEARLSAKAAHLPERMDSSVRASGGLEEDVLLRQLAKNTDDLTLNGGLA